LELKDYEKLLSNIQKELDDVKTDNVFIMPLISIIEQTLESLTNGYYEKPNTYLFDGRSKNDSYRLTLRFEESIENIFTKLNILNSLKSMKIEYL